MPGRSSLCALRRLRGGRAASSSDQRTRTLATTTRAAAVVARVGNGWLPQGAGVVHPCWHAGRQGSRPRFRELCSGAGGGSGGGQWQQYTDPATGKPYYYHVQTQTTQWERPDEMGDSAPGGSEDRKVFTEQQVPSSPLQRVMGFAGLGINLAAGVGATCLDHPTLSAASLSGYLAGLGRPTFEGGLV